jgi:hypothetical protein
MLGRSRRQRQLSVVVEFDQVADDVAALLGVSCERLA